MNWIWTISKWLCGGVIALMAFGAFVTFAFEFGDRIRIRRRRALFSIREVFRSAADGTLQILDADLERRLNAIGKFTTTASLGEREIVWKHPQGRRCDFAPLELVFRIDPDNVGPDEQTFQLWEQYQTNHESHVATFKSRVIELGSRVEPEWSAEKALSSMRQVSIAITQEGYGKTGSHELCAAFRPKWDDEHGYSLLFDPSTNSFGDWREG